MNTTHHHRLLAVAILLCASALGACQSGTVAESAPAEPAAPEAEAPTEPTAEVAAPAAEGLVEVSAEGTSFDPPVEKDRIPNGVWICDMGTVHYARTEQGDGICPRCNMRLHQHNAPAGDDGHEGHDHGTDNHGADEHEGHDHGSGEHGALQREMQHHDDIMQHVRAEGTYDPSDVQRQPGAAEGELTSCPISGEVFEVTEDHAYLEHNGENVYFCCPSCIRRFQRNPERYLEQAG